MFTSGRRVMLTGSSSAGCNRVYINKFESKDALYNFTVVVLLTSFAIRKFSNTRHK